MENIKTVPEQMSDARLEMQRTMSKVSKITQEHNRPKVTEKKTNELIITVGTKSLLVFVLISLIVGFSIGVMYSTINYQQKTINEISKQVNNTEKDNLEKKISSLNKIIDSKDLVISHKDEEITKYSQSLDSLNQEIDSINEELFIFREREELYDKYEIAVMNTNNKRTELSYDDIKYTEDLCLSKGIPTDLIFYMMKLESNFNPELKISQSSARGLLQVIKGTGQWTHTNLLKRDIKDYNHDKMFDPRTNIEYAVTYIDYLFDQAKGNVYEVMKRYSGGYSEFGIGDRYHQLVESHMNKFGYSIAKAQQEYNKLNL